jgi:hypothetical protein
MSILPLFERSLLYQKAISTLEVLTQGNVTFIRVDQLFCQWAMLCTSPVMNFTTKSGRSL